MNNTGIRLHAVYWLGPLVVMLVLLLMNYSGIGWMQTIVSPAINREFGLLENLQLAVILTMLVVSIKGIIRKSQLLEKVIFGLLSLFSVFVFLEEMDYGLHIYEYFFKQGIENKEIVRNFHNQGNNNFYFRQGTYALIVMVFVVLPLLAPRIPIPFFKEVAPPKMTISTVGVYLLVSQLARFIPKMDIFTNNPSLWGNHQEFEELVIYYLFLLYLLDWVFRKPPLTFPFQKKA